MAACPVRFSARTSMWRVVSGALIHDGRVLMGLRKKSGLRPDLWELPGGKVDPDESPHEALRRRSRRSSARSRFHGGCGATSEKHRLRSQHFMNGSKTSNMHLVLPSLMKIS